MKVTSNKIKYGLYLGLAAAITACGGDGGNGNLPGISDFILSQFEIITPQNGSSGACLFPNIQVRVEKKTGLCNHADKVNQFLRLRLKDEVDAWELVPGFVSVDSGSQAEADSCIIETSAKNNLLPEQDWIIEKAIKNAGSVTFDPASAIKFSTGTFDENKACPGNLAISPNGETWIETNLLSIGAYDAQGDLQFKNEFGDLGEIVLQAAIQGGLQGALGLGSTSGYQTEVAFNSTVDNFGLSSRVLVYRVTSVLELFDGFLRKITGEPFDPATDLQLFSGTSQLTGCASGGGDCIYVNPNNHRVVRIDTPPGGWEPGAYLAIVSQKMRSETGRFLNNTYYNMFVIQQ